MASRSEVVYECVWEVLSFLGEDSTTRRHQRIVASFNSGYAEGVFALHFEERYADAMGVEGWHTIEQADSIQRMIGALLKQGGFLDQNDDLEGLG